MRRQEIYRLAIDAADGTERWSSPDDGIQDAPVVVDGTVYVAGDSLYAFEA